MKAQQRSNLQPSPFQPEAGGGETGNRQRGRNAAAEGQGAADREGGVSPPPAALHFIDAEHTDLSQVSRGCIVSRLLQVCVQTSFQGQGGVRRPPSPVVFLPSYHALKMLWEIDQGAVKCSQIPMI